MNLLYSIVNSLMHGNMTILFSHEQVNNGKLIQRAFVIFTNGKNGTIGRQIPFKVLPMVPLVMPLVPMVMPLVPMVPMLPTYGSKWCRQNTACVILPTRETSRDSIW